jgi:hypothetical protein
MTSSSSRPRPGLTAIIPGFGLLADEFEPVAEHLKRRRDSNSVRFAMT